MVKRLLITSAIEETWRKDLPVLFLGEWCRRYDRKDNWGSLDSCMVPYHWDDRHKLFQDYLFLQKLYEELVVEASVHLNQLHGVPHSERYWRILIGPWLGCFIQMLFDRWSMIKKAFFEYELIGARVMRRSAHEFIPNDMQSFQAMFLDDPWNEHICGELIEIFKIPVEFLDAEKNNCFKSTPNEGVSPLKTFQRTVAKYASKLSGALCSNEEFFLYYSYLPIFQDINLQIRLGQVPKLWRQEIIPVFEANSETRQGKFIVEDVDDFRSLVRQMIWRHIPSAYLEGYKSLVDFSNSLPWPKKPKAIFTSNSYWSDDIFKVWAAEKVEGKTPLLTGQHGGNYGMAKWSFSEEHIVAISDVFYSWGWKNDNQPNVVPAGCLKNFGRSISSPKKGLALMVEMGIPRTSYHMYSLPVAGQWLNYFDDQCRFVESLPMDIQKQLVIRLYSHDYGWCQKQRWLDKFPEIKIDDGNEPMLSLLRKTRLYISTYNATTFLESLSLNIPTIIFWNPAHWELRTSAEPCLSLLEASGIFHATPEGAARHMAEVWENVDSWWLCEKTQNARKLFCEKYALVPESPLKKLEQSIRNVTSQI